MSGQHRSFNTYLAVSLALLALASLGCKTAEERRRDHTHTTLWLHLETSAYSPDTNHVMAVQIAGANLRCDSRPFLTEADVQGAAIVPAPEGGQSLRIEFSDHGRMVLDALTSQHRLQRILVFTQFGLVYKSSKSKTQVKKRWLAAPRITRRITDGVAVFTADATPEELDQLVLGLNNVAKENRKPWAL